MFIISKDKNFYSKFDFQLKIAYFRKDIARHQRYGGFILNLTN